MSSWGSTLFFFLPFPLFFLAIGLLSWPQLSLHTLLFQKQLWEQPKTQREIEHCTMTVSLNCIFPAQTDIMCFVERIHVCFSPYLYMHACIQRSVGSHQEWTAFNLKRAFRMQNLPLLFLNMRFVYTSVIIWSVMTWPVAVFAQCTSVCIPRELGSGWLFAPLKKQVECRTPLPFLVSGHREYKTELKMLLNTLPNSLIWLPAVWSWPAPWCLRGLECLECMHSGKLKSPRVSELEREKMRERKRDKERESGWQQAPQYASPKQQWF